ncbi:M81 family metallopeptidase [Holdemania filiformis]|uniref:Microcystin degradation protein MlrC n=1 Tax=Holdemania filiformis TaxID=61171 RepID=A0A412FI41_9FIRM|nr:M81 family metallopeptidase [Holdemania filiformis]MBS5002583.1 M81 family metallopeptidase [Holdemania filiformis]RGR67834.1 microcystin degradation protein MlrC [Holdemania filiformis]
MKVFVGLFNAECNANMPVKSDLSTFDLAFGDQAVEKLYIKEIFDQAGAEILSAVYANAGATGIVEKDAFEAIENSFLTAIRKHLHELDGIYLHLHGASYVEEIGSGDHHLLKAIRALTGPYLPIAVSCDPHGNLTREYVEAIQILRSFRQSPHTDSVDTYRKVSGMLCQFIQNRQSIHAVYRKLPLILGGEQSVSADEPVLSINRYLDELEQDPRILSASWHVGYLRHDCPEAGCGIVVVPQTEADQAYTETVADQLAEYVWHRRHEFHYTGLTAEPEAALRMALDFEGKPAVITDSGDNMTSGAAGWNTSILRQCLALPDLKKTFLFAPIVDPQAFARLKEQAVGQTVAIELGTGRDALSESVSLNVTLRQFNQICKFTNGVYEREMTECALVHIEGTPIDVLISNLSYAVINKHQLEHLGLDWRQYDVTVLKQGYIFPDFKAEAQFYVMSLTDGATPQDTKHIPFKLIQRPMYPIDEI